MFCKSHQSDRTPESKVAQPSCTHVHSEDGILYSVENRPHLIGIWKKTLFTLDIREGVAADL